MEKRTSQKAKEQYENRWGEALEIIKKDITNNKKSLSEILDDWLKYKVSTRFNQNFYFDFYKKLGIPIKRGQSPEKRLVVQNGKYAVAPLDTILDHKFIEILAKYILGNRNRIDYVVELGSGIGINLFLLADKLDQAMLRQITFFSCEFTDSGRKACEELRRFSNGLNMSIEHFDYYNPDFSFLEPNKNVLFFTAHSIEQIPKIDRAVFEAMLKVSDQCSCYHAEPVGWQYDEELKVKREQFKPYHWKRKITKLERKLRKIDRWMISKLGISIVDSTNRYGIDIEKKDIGKSDKVSSTAALYSYSKDYNTNLVSIIKKMEGEGLIHIDLEKVNLYGKKPFNPSSIISWHKIAENETT